MKTPISFSTFTKAKGHISLCLFCLLLADCQRNSYKIEGTAEGFRDGATLYLTNDFTQGIPTDTIIVSEGKFSIEGKADTAMLHMLYAKDDPELNALFILEPGTISIRLSQQQGQSTVGGTKANEAWQELSLMSNEYGKQIEILSKSLYDGEPDQQEQIAIMEKIRHLQADITEKAIALAEKNIDNEFGFFIVANFPEDSIFTSTKKQELIGKMPEALRKRLP
jgi:hypothetical protein